MHPFTLDLIPALHDNYIYVLHEPEHMATYVVDPGESDPVINYLESHNLRLTDILLTHHHADHTGGVALLKQRYACKVWGPPKVCSSLDEKVCPDTKISLHPHISCKILKTPGHTLDHISYWLEDLELLFCGDSLFSQGCGRIFEGDYDMSWETLKRLRVLPSQTQVCAAHEYTLKNAQFTCSMCPKSSLFQQRLVEVEEKIKQGKPTLPSTIGEEKCYNLFLQADEPKLGQMLHKAHLSPLELFSYLRSRRDQY